MLGREAPVAIVGAGIAGLTAALSFAAAGFAVELFERAPALSEAGAGLQLSPNALRVFARLGLQKPLADLGVAAHTVRLRSYRTGRPIAEIPVATGDVSYLSIHRADLQRVLLEAVGADKRIALHLGRELTGFMAEGSGVRMRFANGEERHVSVLIGADGVHSRIAAAGGLAGPQASGAVAWRMMLDRRNDGVAASGGIEAWLGPAKHAVAYPLRGGRQVNLVLIAPKDTDNPDTPDGDAKAQLLRTFERWDPRLLRMVEAAGPASAWPLLSVPANRPWHWNDRVLLIGDAAHAMLPYAAQGAAMAIEDGFMAASLFAAADTRAEAIAACGAIRSPRVARVRRRVAFHQMVYHLPFPLSTARDVVLARRSPQALRKDLAWLYDWVPPEL